jgi:DNA-binding Lrp family transcriptional regulator
VTELSPETRLWNIERGAIATKALGIVADLGIADSLADGPRPVADIAAEVGADADVLRRIMRALASDGVFVEEGAGVFRNNDASKLLRRGHGWQEFAHLFAGVFYAAVDTLDPTTSEPTFARHFGTDFWSWLNDNPDERARFDRAMEGGGKEGLAERLAALEWRDGETVVDVGGGNGALLRALLARRPQPRGIVFDLPETERNEASFGDNLSFVAGSFFERVPAGDAYVLSAILHDWDDERATAILTSIRAAARPDARLLVLESVIQPGNDPYGAKWLDLLMLVLGGRERDEDDWRSLLEGAGFRIEQLEDGLIQARCP